MYIFQPKTLKQFIGNQSVVEQATIALKASKIEKRPLSHTLMTGSPGTGKTTLAKILAKELKGRLIFQLGDTFDAGKILPQLKNNDILFIDEIHRLSTAMEERLYHPLEEGILIPDSSDADQAPIELEPFCLIGATTLPGSLSKPLRDRIHIILNYNPYTLDEMVKIVSQAVKHMPYKMSRKAIQMVAVASRFTPRTAVLLLERIVEYHIVTSKSRSKTITFKEVRDMFNIMQITDDGLTMKDIEYLTLLANASRPLGLKAISLMLMMDEASIVNVIESYLAIRGFIYLTQRGRVVSNAGVEILLKKGVELTNGNIFKEVS